MSLIIAIPLDIKRDLFIVFIFISLPNNLNQRVKRNLTKEKTLVSFVVNRSKGKGLENFLMGQDLLSSASPEQKRVQQRAQCLGWAGYSQVSRSFFFMKGCVVLDRSRTLVLSTGN